jgi:hypothetical protein
MRRDWTGFAKEGVLASRPDFFSALASGWCFVNPPAWMSWAVRVPFGVAGR